MPSCKEHMKSHYIKWQDDFLHKEKYNFKPSYVLNTQIKLLFANRLILTISISIDKSGSINTNFIKENKGTNKIK